VPILEITAEMFSHPLTLAYLQAIMLWPDDGAERDEWMQSVRVGFLTQPSAIASIAPGELAELFTLAREAEPLRKLGPKAKRSYDKGFFAGELLAAAVQEFAARGTLKLESLKTAMVAEKRQCGHKALKFSRSTLDHAIWRDYKSAAHLWAAHAYAVLHEDNLIFPCGLPRLPNFLSLAEFFGREGAVIQPVRRKEPLLDADRLWKVPPELELARYEFDRGNA
jgi:hypothetical protein